MSAANVALHAGSGRTLTISWKSAAARQEASGR